MADAVHAVDDQLLGFVAEHRSNASVLIDSHAVTYEEYGYRAVPFKPVVLTRLGLDTVICLAANANTIAQRVAANTNSRKVVKVDEVEHAQRLQEGVALSYAVLLGIPLYVIDANGPVADVSARVANVVGGGKDSAPPRS